MEQPPIPGYEPIRLLGINLGAVYLARHASSGLLVALKVWSLDHAENIRELHEPLARVNHPNITRLLEVGEFEGNYFCAMEYFEATLEERLRDGPLPEGKVTRLTHAIGLAVDYALSQELVDCNS
jgi:serine/threonine protein kinase